MLVKGEGHDEQYTPHMPRKMPTQTAAAGAETREPYWLLTSWRRDPRNFAMIDDFEGAQQANADWVAGNPLDR